MSKQIMRFHVLQLAAFCSIGMAAHAQNAAAPSAGFATSYADALRLSGVVMADNLMTQVPPVYPEAARAAGVSGDVSLRAIIDTHGKVACTRFRSGDPLLLQAAADAVMQWSYKPYLLEGTPVDVNTVITVTFKPDANAVLSAVPTASISPDAEQNAARLRARDQEPMTCANGKEIKMVKMNVSPSVDASGRTKVSGGVMAGSIVSKTAPVYPPMARAAHVGGTVVLRAIIGKDGHVKDLEAVSGPDMLKGSALDAVRQWAYKPFLMNGQPVEVDTTVAVNFNFVESRNGVPSSIPSPTMPSTNSIPTTGMRPGLPNGISPGIPNGPQH